MNSEFTFYWFPAFVFYTLKDSQIVKARKVKQKKNDLIQMTNDSQVRSGTRFYVGRRLRAEHKTLTSEGRLYHVVISRSFA